VARWQHCLCLGITNALAKHRTSLLLKEQIIRVFKPISLLSCYRIETVFGSCSGSSFNLQQRVVRVSDGCAICHIASTFWLTNEVSATDLFQTAEMRGRKRVGVGLGGGGARSVEAGKKATEIAERQAFEGRRKFEDGEREIFEKMGKRGRAKEFESKFRAMRNANRKSSKEKDETAESNRKKIADDLNWNDDNVMTAQGVKCNASDGKTHGGGSFSGGPSCDEVTNISEGESSAVSSMNGSGVLRAKFVGSRPAPIICPSPAPIISLESASIIRVAPAEPAVSPPTKDNYIRRRENRAEDAVYRDVTGGTCHSAAAAIVALDADGKKRLLTKKNRRKQKALEKENGRSTTEYRGEAKFDDDDDDDDDVEDNERRNFHGEEKRGKTEGTVDDCFRVVAETITNRYSGAGDNASNLEKRLQAKDQLRKKKKAKQVRQEEISVKPGKKMMEMERCKGYFHGESEEEEEDEDEKSVEAMGDVDENGVNKNDSRFNCSLAPCNQNSRREESSLFFDAISRGR